MWVSVEGKKVNSFKIQTESFINEKLSSSLSYLFVQWQQDLSFLEASHQMNIMPVLPRWAVCHCWASRHVLHRYCSTHTLSVINPYALLGVLKPLALVPFFHKQKDPVGSKSALQTPDEQKSHDEISAFSHISSIVVSSLTSAGSLARNLSPTVCNSPVWRQHDKEIFPAARRTQALAPLPKHQQLAVPSFHSLPFKKCFYFSINPALGFLL